MAEIKEPEEIKSETNNAQTNYNPFDEPVNEKVYSRPNVKLRPEELVHDIPEPKFQPPPIDPEVLKEEAPKKKEEPVNPEFNQMSNKDKKASGDHMANLIMTGYEWLWAAANKTMLFSKRKMQKLSTSGEVDFSIPIPYDLQGNMMSGAEFIEEYNKQQDGTLKVTPEFKERVMPVLSRVLTKRGIGMTDEQYLLAEVAMDSGQKVIAIYNAVQTMKMMVEQMKDLTEAYKNSSYRPQASAPPPQATQSAPSEPTPPPPPTQDEYEGDMGGYYEQEQEVEYTPPVSHYTDATQDVSDRVIAQVDSGVSKPKAKIAKPKSQPPRGKRGRKVE